MAYPGLYRLQNFVVQQMELWYFEWLDLGGFGKKTPKDPTPGEAFPLETTEQGAVGGKKATTRNAARRPNTFFNLHLDPRSCGFGAMEQAQDLQKSLKELGQHSPFCWSTAESTKKRFHVIQVPTNTSHLQTNHPNIHPKKLIDFFLSFFRWPGQVSRIYL